MSSLIGLFPPHIAGSYANAATILGGPVVKENSGAADLLDKNNKTIILH